MRPDTERHEDFVERLLVEIARKLSISIVGESLILRQGFRTMATMADVKTKLDAQETLLADLADRIKANVGDPAALQAIADEIDAHNATIGQLDTSTPIVPAPAP